MVVLLDVFVDYLLGWGVVFVVTHKNVIYKWTFTRQKRNPNLKRLPVIKLTFSFHLPLINTRIILHLHQKPQLSRHTKIRNRQKANLLQHQLPRNLILTVSRVIHILQSQGRNLHYISNVQTPNPVTLVQVPQHISHVTLFKLSRNHKVVD